jgi:transposase
MTYNNNFVFLLFSKIKRQDMKKYQVTLTMEEREELLTIVHKGKHNAKKIRNANILLNCDEGNYSNKVTNTTITRILNVSPRSIDRVKKVFVEDGLEIVLEGKPRQRKYNPKIDGDKEAHLIALACSETPEGYARWSLRLLADKMVELKYIESISHEAVRQVLKKTKLSLGKRNDL